VSQIGPFFKVAVEADKRTDAIALANRTCEAYVQRLAAQRQRDQDTEAAQLQAKIADLQQSVAKLNAIPANQRSPADQSKLTGQTTAITRNEQLVAFTLSAPPDNIALTSRSRDAVQRPRTSLAR